MDEERRSGVSGWLRGLRCSPFVVVALCFFLPFFSVSSCGGGPTASADGIGIVVGANPGVQSSGQPSQSGRIDDARIESEARSVSRAARPWATAALILAIVGIVLMATVGRLYRVTSLAVSAAALGALFKIWGAVPSRDGTPEDGLLLATLVLLLTVVWQACAVIVLAVQDARHPRIHPDWEEAQSRHADHGDPPRSVDECGSQSEHGDEIARANTHFAVPAGGRQSGQDDG